MARIGAFCFPGTGHLNPLTALARRLQQRGHTVVIFGIPDVESRVRAAGIEFCQIGQSDYPLGTLPELDRKMSELAGLASFKFTFERIGDMARMVLREGPESLRRTNVDAVLVDEADFSGSVADYLGLPWISLALPPPMVWDSRIPPFCFGWPAGRGAGHVRLRRLRNAIAMRVLARGAAPIYAEVNRHRIAWGLEPMKHPSDALSKLAQITQLPAALEFDVGDPPPLLHYTGPFVDPGQRPPVDFEWDRLDGRPLVYASLGTLQNGLDETFRIIAAACAGLPVQLVISLGGGLAPERLGALDGDPIVVKYAPQLEIVKRSAVVITHAGINTVLESLTEGVPLVCLPIGNDQPGISARVAARGAGVVVPRSRLNAKRLRSAVRAVLDDESYRCAARKVQASIQQIDGLELAAELIEDALKIGRGTPSLNAANLGAPSSLLSTRP